MIDSINYSIFKVKKRQIINFYQRFKRYSADYVYTYNYKGIHFNYYLFSNVLTVQTHTFTILHKKDVTEKDIKKYLENLENIIKEVVNIDKIELHLTRCDYCLDLKIQSDEEFAIIFELLNKHCTKFKYITAQQQYENGVYLVKPKSSMCINIYNKYEQLLNVQGIEDENFKNVIRIELQLKKKKIKDLYKKEEISRDIKNYWNHKTMENQYFSYLEKYLYKGDYYKFSKAKELILLSSYSNTLKKGLIEFIKNVNEYGMTNASATLSYNTVKKYIQLLDNLKINPITINDKYSLQKIDNLLNRARKLAEDTKFNN